MDYIRHYNKLIERAKNRSLDGYKERHHIIPKSLGGSDDKDNIVNLTAKEHYIAHHLLWKHYDNLSDILSSEKMSHAFWSMCIQHRDKRFYINSSSYDIIKRHRAGILSEKYKGVKNPNYGNGDKMIGEKNPMYGVRRSDEWKTQHSNILRESGKFKKENNSSSKEYYVVDVIHGTEVYIKKGYLREYCEERGIKYITLFVTEKRGTPISRGVGKGLILRKVSSDI